MSGFDHEHDELLGALRGETCDDASRGRMRDKLAAAGVLSASAAVVSAGAGTATSALAHAAPVKTGLFKLLGAGKLLGSGALLVAGAAVAVSLSVPAERAAPRPAPRTYVAPSAAPVVPAAEAPEPAPQLEPEQAPAQRKAPRASARAKDPLARESALLTGAARLLHAGDLRGAARLLDEHERSFPDGVLRTERELARQRVETERRAREAP
jgi:hypothetical protein